ITASHTPEAKAWEGWGTTLKPSFEPVVVARKPLAGTVAVNVLAYGTGAMNIAATRVHSGSDDGRWPSNVVLDDSQAAELDAQTGVLVSNGEGGASRFFPVFRYEAK